MTNAQEFTPATFKDGLKGHTSFDGGDLDCGNGLLLLIRKHLDPLDPGKFLEIASVDSTVEVDLPSWCSMTGNDLVDTTTTTVQFQGRELTQWRFLVCKGAYEGAASMPQQENTPEALVPAAGKGKKLRKRPQMAITQEVVTPHIPAELPEPAAAPALEPLAVHTMGSWPRPSWLIRALHEHLEGRLSQEEFDATADDAVQLVVAAQERADVDVVTDGEMRRDNYSSFVGGLLQNCQLIPITDLLPYVDDPVQFERELRALDVPAGEVRHPAVFGPLGRDRSLAVHEAQYLKTITDRAVKVDLPGPYLLTRTMWMECVSDRAYPDRETLATDVVRILREEIAELLAAGVALVEIDEPVLSEVVYGNEGGGGRTFMCGALGERKAVQPELEFARDLIAQVAEGFPADRLGIHVCRGNWTPDESKALSGDYAPLLPLLSSVPIGNVIVETCTPRAGDWEHLTGLREDQRIGIGIFNQKAPQDETFEAVLERGRTAVKMFGKNRVLLNTDCGFATFADNPIVAGKQAEAAMAMLVKVRDALR